MAHTEIWKTPSASDCTEQERPIIGILERANWEIFTLGNAEAIWDGSLHYFPYVWTDDLKKKAWETMEKRGSAQVQWSRVEFHPSGEFARVRSRFWYPATGTVPFEGMCLFRKFRCGWRSYGKFPFCIYRWAPDWGNLLLGQVEGAVAFRFDIDGVNQESKTPDWATSENAVRVLDLAYLDFKARAVFPLTSFLSFLVSDDLVVRKFAYEKLVSAFQVDYGYSEERIVMGRYDLTTAWRLPWIEWAVRTFGEGSKEEVPWPSAIPKCSLFHTPSSAVLGPTGGIPGERG